MLVLTLKEGDKVRVGEGRSLVIVKYSRRPESGRHEIRLAFDAPPEIPVLREDVWLRDQTSPRRKRGSR